MAAAEEAMDLGVLEESAGRDSEEVEGEKEAGMQGGSAAEVAQGLREAEGKGKEVEAAAAEEGLGKVDRGMGAAVVRAAEEGRGSGEELDWVVQEGKEMVGEEAAVKEAAVKEGVALGTGEKGREVRLQVQARVAGKLVLDSWPSSCIKMQICFELFLSR